MDASPIVSDKRRTTLTIFLTGFNPRQPQGGVKDQQDFQETHLKVVPPNNIH